MKRCVFLLIDGRRVILFDQPLNEVDAASSYCSVKTVCTFMGREDGVQPMHDIITSLYTGVFDGRDTVYVETVDIDKIKPSGKYIPEDLDLSDVPDINSAEWDHMYDDLSEEDEDEPEK